MIYFEPVTIEKKNGSSVASDQGIQVDNPKIETIPIRTAVQRLLDARNLPEVKKLFSVIWQSNELHLMFADTGIGKSILAVALADSLSKGHSFIGLENDHDSLRVLYYDFELSDRQFRKRYSDETGNEYNFSQNFFIDTIDFADLMTKYPGRKLDSLLNQKLRQDIEDYKAQVLIIDNLTYLSGQSTQDTQIALEVMRRLNEMKHQYDLSILVLAHTPKRSMCTPITINDLAGSKHLSNFADSVSAIGKSIKGKSIRYIKQVKPSRSSEILFDTDNVLCCEISKHNTILTFDHLGFSPEKEHLNLDPVKQKNEQKEAASELRRQGKSVREIADQLGIPSTTIFRWIQTEVFHPEQMEQTEQLEQNGTDGTAPF
ncbi:MAG: LuxR family transcriptional regulator [Bacteroidetes bacterium HGW-Bacteroidetes-21]|jgi:RecA-family ATPase|nr:MAG: LuxR family transcriptional regulator [Bacteroidetes bacterium HGW-Bacteroidetes-21]